jgi:hypothetical protein
MLGHASIQQTQRYLNVRTKTQERAGSELEQQRPTASLGIGKLIDLISSTVVSVLSPGTSKAGCGGGFEPPTFGYEPIGSAILGNVDGLCQPTLPAPFLLKVHVLLRAVKRNTKVPQHATYVTGFDFRILSASVRAQGQGPIRLAPKVDDPIMRAGVLQVARRTQLHHRPHVVHFDDARHCLSS